MREGGEGAGGWMLTYLSQRRLAGLDDYDARRPGPQHVIPVVHSGRQADIAQRRRRILIFRASGKHQRR